MQASNVSYWIQQAKNITCPIAIEVSKCFLSVLCSPHCSTVAIGSGPALPILHPLSSTSLDGLCAEKQEEDDNNLD